MLDDRGRLFGWINLLDLLVILIILAVIGAGLYRYYYIVPETVGEARNVVTVVEVDEVRDFTVERVQTGDRLRFNETSLPYGMIVEYEVEPHREVVPTADGSLVEAVDPLHFDVQLTVESVAMDSPGALRISNEDVRIGSQFLLKTKYLRVLGTVLSIEVLDE